MNKKISSLAGAAIIIVIAAIAGLIIAYQNWTPKPVAENSPTPTPAQSGTPVSTITPKATPTAQIASSDPWATFELYKIYLAEKNIDKLSEVSKLNKSQACPNGDCEAFFIIASFNMENLTKEKLVNVWKDEKQAIYSSNPIKAAQNYMVDKIIFAKLLNDWKIVRFVYSGELDPTDSDKDGISDQREKCEGPSKYDSKCVQTDPLKRDTDGDGWWDGVDAEI